MRQPSKNSRARVDAGYGKKSSLFFAALLMALFPSLAFGDEITSSDFRVLNPFIFSAGFSTSTNFQLVSVLGQIGTGTSAAPSFTLDASWPAFLVPTPIPPAPSLPASPAPLSGAGGIPLSLAIKSVSARLVGGPSNLPPLPAGSKINLCASANFYCDDEVSLKDLSAFLFLSGYSAADNPADFNHDGVVDLSDLSVLFAHWNFRSPLAARSIGVSLMREPIAPPRDTFVFGILRHPKTGQGIQAEQSLARMGTISGTNRPTAPSLNKRRGWCGISSRRCGRASGASLCCSKQVFCTFGETSGRVYNSDRFTQVIRFFWINV